MTKSQFELKIDIINHLKHILSRIEQIDLEVEVNEKPSKDSIHGWTTEIENAIGDIREIVEWEI